MYNEQIRIRASGTKSNPLVIKSLHDTAAVIDGTGFIMSESGNGILAVKNAAYVNLIGFKVQNSVANGIYIGNCENIRVTRCKSYNTQSSGIGVWFSACAYLSF